MEEYINYANLLSFVQVGVALNFGLLYLDKKNAFATVYKEYQQYLMAISRKCRCNAGNTTKRVRSTMPVHIREKKACVDRWKNIIIDTYKHDFDYPYLVCWGVGSGVFGFWYLLAIGFLGLNKDGFLMDFTILLGEIVSLMEIISFIILYNVREDSCKKRKRVFQICSYFFLSIIGVIFCVYNNWIFRINWSMRTCFIASLYVAYTPIIWLLGIATWHYWKVVFCRMMCYLSILKLKMSLE